MESIVDYIPYQFNGDVDNHAHYDLYTVLDNLVFMMMPSQELEDRIKASEVYSPPDMYHLFKPDCVIERERREKL